MSITSTPLWTVWGDGGEPVATGLSYPAMVARVGENPEEWYGEQGDTGETYEAH